jgi:hypothetical protein
MSNHDLMGGRSASPRESRDTGLLWLALVVGVVPGVLDLVFDQAWSGQASLGFVIALAATIGLVRSDR